MLAIRSRGGHFDLHDSPRVGTVTCLGRRCPADVHLVRVACVVVVAGVEMPGTQRERRCTG